jgi:hypothetical protein
VFLLGGGAIFWKSCKQIVLTKSTMKAKLIVLDTTESEGQVVA